MEHRYFPDANRLSVLTAVILLAFALTRLIALPPYLVQTNILGADVSFRITANSIVAFLVAGLTATGMDWLLRSHPHFQHHNTTEHLILPTLTAWIIGVAIYSFSQSALWWLILLFGGLFLVLICLAEYIAVDSTDARYGVATAALTSLSFILLLVLIVALKTAALRLFLLVPSIAIASGLVCLRTLRLRGGRWDYFWAGGITLAITQFSAPLHYWPIIPLQFGLAVLGPLYSLTSMATNMSEGQPLRRALIEPVVMLVIIWGAAILL